MTIPFRLLAVTVAMLTGCVGSGPDLESEGESIAPTPLGDWDLYQENTLQGGMEVRLVDRKTTFELFMRTEFDGLTELGVKLTPEQRGFMVEGNGQVLASTSTGVSPEARDFLGTVTDFIGAYTFPCPACGIYDAPVIVPIIRSCAEAIVPVLECRSVPTGTAPCNISELKTCLGALWSAERSRTSYMPRPVHLMADGNGAHDPVPLVAGAPRVFTGKLHAGENRRLWISVPQSYDDSLDIKISAVRGDAIADVFATARVVPLVTVSSASSPYNGVGVLTGAEIRGPWRVEVHGARSADIEYQLELTAHSWVRVQQE